MIQKTRDLRLLSRVCLLLAVLALPLCMTFSAVGLLTLKWAQSRQSMPALVLVATLEALAFGMYPCALYRYSMRITFLDDVGVE